jgi:hypothetical protein
MWVSVCPPQATGPRLVLRLPHECTRGGVTCGLEAHEWHLLFSWTDRSGPSRHLCPGALVKNVSSNQVIGLRQRPSGLGLADTMGRRPLGNEPTTINRHSNGCGARAMMDFWSSGDLFAGPG